MKVPGSRSSIRWLVLCTMVTTWLALVAACGDDNGAPKPTAAPTSAADASPTMAASPAAVALEGDINVFAAASLTDAFTELGTAFEDAYPETTVQFNFAASSALATQINEGAPADVFASADNNQMKVVVDAGNAEGPQLFVKNLPVVVVPADSELETFENLAKDGLRLVLAGPDVPVGRYSRQILENASGPGGIAPDFAERVLANLRSDEANVRAVLSKVQLGEADAGIVYRTDAQAAVDEVMVIDIPSQFNVVAEYPIAAVSDSNAPDVAEAFIAFVLSPDGQAILREYGFSSP